MTVQAQQIPLVHAPMIEWTSADVFGILWWRWLGIVGLVALALYTERRPERGR